MRNLAFIAVLLAAGALALVPLQNCGRAGQTPRSDPAAVALLTDAIGNSQRQTFIGEAETVEPFDPRASAVVKMMSDPPDHFRLEVLDPEWRRGSYMVRNGKEAAFSKKFKRVRPPGHREYRDLKFLIDNLDLVRKNYEIKTAGTGPARCGRQAHRITIAAPQKSSRPSLDLWVDVETKMVLAAERRSPEGEVTYSFAFRTIDLKPRFDESGFRPPEERMGPSAAAGGVERTEFPGGIDQACRAFDFPVRRPGSVPSGFILKKVLRVKTQTGQMCLMVYSDGLTALTVGFADPKGVMRPRAAKAADEHEGVVSRGGRRLGFHRMVGRSFKEVKVVVISELSEEESARVIDSLGFS